MSGGHELLDPGGHLNCLGTVGAAGRVLEGDTGITQVRVLSHVKILLAYQEQRALNKSYCQNI